MNLAWLEVFREVALRGSLTAAGEALGYTQSTVSRQISALETASASVRTVHATTWRGVATPPVAAFVQCLDVAAAVTSRRRAREAGGRPPARRPRARS